MLLRDRLRGTDDLATLGSVGGGTRLNHHTTNNDK